jgi:acetyl-CoA carboxylase carboxyl transferase subunit beta
VNWINSVVRPKINSFLRREMPDNMWVKDPESGQMVYLRDLEANQFVVPGSGYHMRIDAELRLKELFDNGEFEKIELPEVTIDPLKFRDEKKYIDKLKQARSKTERKDAMTVGEGHLDGLRLVAGVQDFEFMGGSLGMAAGEAIITGMRKAVELNSPFILFAASGGARMQEGILSLMQMPRTTVAVQELREARLPYIVVLTNPTTGGVTASYAMLGDVHIAEPGALVGFAGPRVIEQTIREKLPEGFQRAEYLLEHGMIDMVVHRHDMRSTLSRIVHLLMKEEAVQVAALADNVSEDENLSFKTYEDEPVEPEADEGPEEATAPDKVSDDGEQAEEELPRAAEMTSAQANETERLKNRKPKKTVESDEWAGGFLDSSQPKPSV